MNRIQCGLFIKKIAFLCFIIYRHKKTFCMSLTCVLLKMSFILIFLLYDQWNFWLKCKSRLSILWHTWKKYKTWQLNKLRLLLYCYSTPPFTRNYFNHPLSMSENNKNPARQSDPPGENIYHKTLYLIIFVFSSTVFCNTLNNCNYRYICCYFILPHWHEIF